jgi:hypothetical protein
MYLAQCIYLPKPFQGIGMLNTRQTRHVLYFIEQLYEREPFSHDLQINQCQKYCSEHSPSIIYLFGK